MIINVKKYIKIKERTNQSKNHFHIKLFFLYFNSTFFFEMIRFRIKIFLLNYVHTACKSDGKNRYSNVIAKFVFDKKFVEVWRYIYF